MCLGWEGWGNILGRRGCYVLRPRGWVLYIRVGGLGAVCWGREFGGIC